MLKLDRVILRQGDFALTADLELAAGSVTALMGPSGGGKSTLLASIAGFLAPVSGRILWQGADLGPLAPGARPVSILFQDNNLFAHLTLEQNLALGLQGTARLNIGQQAKVAAMLASLGLQGLGGRKPGSLSGGQQGRAALGRVLLADRPVVLLDEPFATLGPGMRDEMLMLAAQELRARGRTVLMVTHDPADAARIASQVVAVQDGVAQPPVLAADFLANPPENMRAYLGQPHG